MNRFPPIRQRPPIIQREFRGVNKLDSFSIGDSFATEATNLSSAKYPTLSTRQGYSLLGSAMPAAVNGLGAWKDIELQAISNGTWYKYSGGSWTSTGTTGLGTNDASFANFKGGFSDINLLMANGSGQIRKYDGSSVSTISDSPSGANYTEQFMVRAWTAVGNDLHCCASENASNWNTFNGDDSDPYIKTIDTNDGETINGISAGLSALTVFKPSSIHKLMGYVPSDFTLLPVTREIGIINNKCAVTVQGVMYILDDTGLYQYYGSTLPDKSFSGVVQYYIDNMNKSASQTCFLSSDGRNLYVAIPMTGSTPDTLLVYDTQFKIWYVWNNWNPVCGVKMGNELYLGDSTGKVFKPSGTTDNGAAITWKWVSKPFGSGSMNQRIRWYKLWLVVDVPVGSTMSVYVSKSSSGDSDWASVKTITGSLQSVRMPLNLGGLAMGNWLRVKFEGTGPVNIYEWDREQEEMPLL